MIICISAPL